MTCNYPHKGTYRTREEARAGIISIRTKVIAAGIIYSTLYPFRCPREKHWHLTSFRQGTKTCPRCGERRPAWYDWPQRVWVIYAHGDCLTDSIGAHDG